MDTKTFLDNFGHIADAPNGVQKLRELLLELAVQGKLVNRDLKEDPASKLLELIDAKEKRLIKEGVIKATKLPEIMPEEHPYEPPQGWEWVRLGAITSKIGSGSTPRGGKSVYTESGAIFLRSQNVWNEGLKLDDVAYIPNKVHQKMSNTNVLSSDILLNITGASLGRCALVPDDLGEANVSQHVTIIRPIIVEMSQYLHKLILSPYVQKMIWGRQVGMAREGLSKKVLELFEIPLPPLEEQKRIVAKVNQLMSLCDQLETQQKQKAQTRVALNNAALDKLLTAQNPDEFNHHWQRIANDFRHLYDNLENLSKLRSGILQLAVEGHLTKRDETDQSVFKLIEEIETNRSRSKKKGYKKDSQPVMVEIETPELPGTWSWIPLGDLITLMDSGWSPACEKHPTKDNKTWGVLKTTAVQTLKYWEHENKQLPVKLEPKLEYEVKAGDILITRAGPKQRVGICCLVKETRPRLMASDKIIRFHLKEDWLYPDYVALAMNAGYTNIYLEKQKSGMAVSQMNISQTKLCSTPIPVPPLEEQKRITAKVDQLMSLCDLLEARLALSLDVSERLNQAVVEKFAA